MTNLLIEGAALLLLRILSLRLVNDTSVLPAPIYIQVFHPNEAQVWPLSKPEIFPSFFLCNLFSLYTVTVSKILVIICLSREDFSKKNRHSSQFYILLALLVSLGQVTLWPVGVLTSPYIFWGQENKENDHQLKKLMIVEQILLVGTSKNVWRTVRRIWLLMLGCKGLIFNFSCGFWILRHSSYLWWLGFWCDKELLWVLLG